MYLFCHFFYLETIAEVLQELSHDKFLINDISFLFEMSRKRAISPYALVIALIYLDRLKKTKKSHKNNLVSNTKISSDSFDKYSVSYLTNTELCLVSLVIHILFIYYWYYLEYSL